MRSEAEELIRLLDLKPHPEGGYYRETYRATESVDACALPERYGADRNLATAIYYLLTPDTFSVMHKLKSDEVFHFYVGDPVEMLILRNDGQHEQLTLGPDIAAGQHVQLVVPRGWWQGCRLKDGGAVALLGCTVAPGFDFKDYQEGRRTELQEAYPKAAGMIVKLTRL